ncbi:hypothetical protein D3C87_1861180 [compost metagenome]
MATDSGGSEGSGFVVSESSGVCGGSGVAEDELSEMPSDKLPLLDKQPVSPWREKIKAANISEFLKVLCFMSYQSAAPANYLTLKISV